MKGTFSLRSREGCKNWLALLIAIILVSGFIAAMISSQSGSIKIESISIDARGAELTGDLYYPAGTNDEHRLPAVIIAPGAGVVKENMKGLAEDLAKQGYVVFNCNPYGNGLSETPTYNENDMGPDQFNIFATPLGVLDAVHFVRTLEFVDKTRIGITGHSQGSRRAGYAALMDCGYYTFDDMMFNLLHDSFGVEVTAEDIDKGADVLAQAKLTKEELAIYEQLKAQYKVDYDSMTRSICLIGSTAQFCNPTAVVQVAGVDVVRTCKVNECVINGKYDFGYVSFNNDATTKAAWYIDPAEDIVNEGYYALDDLTGTSRLIGQFRKDTILNNADLKAAIENRTLRMVMLTYETHSKNFFSAATAARVVDYFNQTLNNHADVVSTSAGEASFLPRELMNTIAMWAMIAMIIPVVGLFMLDKRYAEIPRLAALKADSKPTPAWGKWLVIGLTVVLNFLAIYFLNAGKNLINFKTNLAFPLMLTAWTSIQLLVWLALMGVISIIIYLVATRKASSFVEFLKSNLRIGVKNILRCFIIAAAFITAGYLMLTVSEYLFQQDYRFWMAAYAELKANHWMYVCTYGALALPFFLIISCAVNFLSNQTMGAKKGTTTDLVVTVLVNSAGIWLCCIINAVLAYSGAKTDGLFSSFLLTYGAIMTIPINVFVLRKSYQQTKTIWVGAIACSLLTAWLLVSTSGMNGSWIPQSWLSIFLGR